MRVIHVASWGKESANGINSALTTVLPELRKVGHEVEVWSPSPHSDRLQMSDRGEVKVVHFPVRRARTSPLPRVPREIQELLRSRAQHADLLHLHSVYNRINVELAQTIELPIVWTLHGGLSPKSERNKFVRKRLFWLAFDRKLMANAQAVIAVSRGEFKYLRGRFTDAPLVLLENPLVELVPACCSQKASGPAECAGVRFGLAESDFFLFLGRLDIKQKGLDVLLRAFGEMVSSSGSTAKLALAGPCDGTSCRRLEKMARKLGIHEQVLFLGPQYDSAKIWLMTRARALVLASRWEGLPIVAMEALSVGLPVIATTDANLGEYCEEASDNLTCEVRVSDLAKQMQRLAASTDEELTVFREQSRRLGSHFPSGSQAARRLEAAYLDVLRQIRPFH